MQFEVTIPITDDEARVFVNHIYACPDTSETFNKYRDDILSLLRKGILRNSSGQYGRYQLNRSEWGERYFWLVKCHVEQNRPELLEKDN